MYLKIVGCENVTKLQRERAKTHHVPKEEQFVSLTLRGSSSHQPTTAKTIVLADSWISLCVCFFEFSLCACALRKSKRKFLHRPFPAFFTIQTTKTERRSLHSNKRFLWTFKTSSQPHTATESDLNHPDRSSVVWIGIDFVFFLLYAF